jgi:hypothetical protein
MQARSKPEKLLTIGRAVIRSPVAIKSISVDGADISFYAVDYAN